MPLWFNQNLLPYPAGHPARTWGQVWNSAHIEPISNTLSKSIELACTTVFVYYCISNFQDEYEYVWKRRWSLGKALYLLGRYSGGTFLVLVCLTHYPESWRYTCRRPFDRDSAEKVVTWRNGLRLCGFLYVGPGAAVTLICEGIMMYRVYVLFGRSRKVRIMMSSLVALSIAFVTLQAFGYTNRVSPPSSGSSVACLGFCNVVYFARQSNFSCCARGALTMSYVGWLFSLIVESVLFSMVLWKYKSEGKIGTLLKKVDEPMNQDIIFSMTRDSVKYFAIAFSICFTGFIISFNARSHPHIIFRQFMDQNYYSFEDTQLTLFLHHQLNAYQTCAITAMSIFAPKLLINTQRKYYGDFVGDVTELTWDAERRSRVSSINMTGTTIIDWEVEDHDHNCDRDAADEDSIPLSNIAVNTDNV